MRVRVTHAAKFSFPKMAGTLKWIFFENLQNPPFYIEEQSPRKLEIKSWFIYCIVKIPKNAQNGFWSVQGKTQKTLGFSSVFAF